jgi:glycosyltransferase involved in cell wall biosynthesis
VKRVMQVMAGAHHGGAEAFFTRLAVALGAAGLEQSIVIRRDAQRAQLLREGGIDPVEAPFRSFLDWRTPRVLKHEVRRFKPDVLLAWMNRATDFCRPGRYVFAARLGGYYDPKHYRRFDHLVANTEDIRQWLIAQGFAPERVHYLPNFAEGRPMRPLQRATFETPEDAPLLLCLGRMHPNKAFDVALEALAELPGAYLWLAGDGPERAGLGAKVAQLGIADRVRFIGWRDDVPALLASADMLVCPSRHEPLGNVIIEGWAHGCPVVASSAAGPRWLIRHGLDGLLVPIDDAQALAAALRRLIEDRELGRALAAAGRARIESEFSESVVVARYLEFFERVRR